MKWKPIYENGKPQRRYLMFYPNLTSPPKASSIQ